MTLFSEQERKRIVREVIEDIDEITTWRKTHNPDDLDDIDLNNMSMGLSRAWLVIHRKKTKIPEIPFSKRVENIETLFKQIDDKVSGGK